MAPSSHLLSIVLFTFLFKIASSIRCYDCTSVNNSMCLDPSLYDPETLTKYMRPVDCQAGVYTPATQDFFCRKIVQTILHKAHDPEVRITRGCGWVRHRRECYKADNDDHLETVCQCFSDTCNAGSLFKLGSIVVVSVLAFRLVI